MSVATLERTTTDTSFEVRPLNPTIGAEIFGIDLREPLSSAGRAQIRELLLKWKVLFFRDQPLNRDQHLAFAAQFGELYAHPSGGVDGHRIIQPISALEAKKIYGERRNENHWHTDTSWRLNPSLGAVLRAVDVPEVGGDTIWADAGAVYRSLDPEFRERIDHLYVIHDFQEALARAGEVYPLVAHPIVRTHPETGEDLVWVNWSLKPRVLDVTKDESEAILAGLYDAVKKPEHHARFRWRKDSVAFWDNRAAVHYAVRDYGDYPRVMERVLIASDDIPHRVRQAA